MSPRSLDPAPSALASAVDALTASDRIDKFDQYLAGKVQNYWIVDPRKRTIEAYRIRRGTYVLAGSGQGSDVARLPPFPELDIPLSLIWLPDLRRPQRRRGK